MLLQEAASERTIGRDLDQTALHKHAKNEVCPTCDPVREVPPFDRHVSPAILEFRIQELEKANQNLTELYAQACKDRDAMIERVLKFERFTDILANHLDALLQIANPPQPKPDYPRAA